MEKLLNVLKVIFQSANWKKLAPHLVAIIVGLCALFGVVVDENNLSDIILVLGGAVYTVICLFVKPNKEENGEKEEE